MIPTLWGRGGAGVGAGGGGAFVTGFASAPASRGSPASALTIPASVAVKTGGGGLGGTTIISPIL